MIVFCFSDFLIVCFYWAIIYPHLSMVSLSVIFIISAIAILFYLLDRSTPATNSPVFEYYCLWYWFHRLGPGFNYSWLLKSGFRLFSFSHKHLISWQAIYPHQASEYTKSIPFSFWASSPLFHRPRLQIFHSSQYFTI